MALYDPALDALKTRLEKQIARTEENLNSLRNQLAGVNKMLEHITTPATPRK